ncbi:hypothetical protein ACTFIR_011799 [Dictyostelium discoideum]
MLVVFQELYLLGIGSPLVGHDLVFQDLVILGLGHMGRGGWVSVLCGGGGGLSRLSMGVVYKVVIQELYLLGIGSPLVGHDVVFQVILGLGHMGRKGLSMGVVYKVVFQGSYYIFRYIIIILGIGSQ